MLLLSEALPDHIPLIIQGATLLSLAISAAAVVITTKGAVKRLGEKLSNLTRALDNLGRDVSSLRTELGTLKTEVAVIKATTPRFQPQPIFAAPPPHGVNNEEGG